jgi:enterochelin esterase-like enzyme
MGNMDLHLWLIFLLIGLLVGLYWRAQRRRAALLESVEVVAVADFPSAYLGYSRPLSIYLPPNYRHSQARYPVLYLNDGQDADALRLRQTMAELMNNGRCRPFITVAIPTNEERLQEYGTAVCPNAQGLGSKAAAYTRFVIDELLPWVNQEFRTKSGPGQTAFLGASLGGLSAFDIVWHNPEWFGVLGVLSGSFWWRAGEEETAVAPNRRIAHSQVRQSDDLPAFRAWFQAGTLDEQADRDQNGVIDAIQDTVELIDELEALGYRRGRELVYHEVSGGRHNYDTWAAVLHAFLTWAFPP